MERRWPLARDCRSIFNRPLTPAIAMSANQDDGVTGDPIPRPPVQPDLDECCRSGCVPCVFDLYEEAMERYRIELAAWEARRANDHRGQRMAQVGKKGDQRG